jgi:hypothetical protein
LTDAIALDPGAAVTVHAPAPGARTITYVVASLVPVRATALAVAAAGECRSTGTTVAPPGPWSTTDGADPDPVTAMSSNGAPAAAGTA